MTLSSDDSVAKYIAASGQAAWNVPNLSPQTPLRAIEKVGLSVPAPWGAAYR